jgi:hypothetical protein
MERLLSLLEGEKQKGPHPRADAPSKSQGVVGVAAPIETLPNLNATAQGVGQLGLQTGPCDVT